jgi:glycosyltransferase involved in cell wall biosynthesis
VRVAFYLADQNPHRDRSRGITSYSDGLLAALSRRGDLEVACVASRSSYAGPGAGPPALPFRSDGLVGRLVADHLHPWLAPVRADLWHYPKGFLPLVGGSHAQRVGTVHDTIVDWYAQRHPDTRSRAAFAYWRVVLVRSLARLDRVITVSECSRRAIEELCARSRVACPPITVTGQGSRFEALALAPAKKDDCVLHLCSPLPHKGTDRLLADWESLEREERDLPRLRLVGTPTRAQAARIARLRAVELLPPASDAELAAALASARALLLPSEIEGFGLPALEAACLGTPVVFVRGTAVEEVLGADAPGGYQPGQPESLRGALDEALDLTPEALRSRAARLRARFGWDACAARTVAVWRELA